MTLTLVGDFADPLSFIASQRVEQIRSLGLREFRWFAVEAVRTRPMQGRPVEAALVAQVRRLAAPGEALLEPELRVPNSRAATAAYAESLTDGVPDEMRRALFDALWKHGRAIGDPDVIRQVVFDVLNPLPPRSDIGRRVRANLPLVPLGDADPIATTRRLGFIVSMGRGPLTLAGQERIEMWRRLWQQRGAPTLPLLLTELGQALTGERALAWLADQVALHDRGTTAAGMAGPRPYLEELSTQQPDNGADAVTDAGARWQIDVSRPLGTDDLGNDRERDSSPPAVARTRERTGVHVHGVRRATSRDARQRGKEPSVTPDITTREDIAALLTDFYSRAFADPLIGPLFTDVARLDLRTHLPVMCDFWETVLLGAGNYRRNTFTAHRRLAEQQPLSPVHFTRWLTLWTATVDSRHAGPVAQRAKLQAERIAHSMSRRLNPNQPHGHAAATAAQQCSADQRPAP